MGFANSDDSYDHDNHDDYHNNDSPYVYDARMRYMRYMTGFNDHLRYTESCAYVVPRNRIGHIGGEGGEWGWIVTRQEEKSIDLDIAAGVPSYENNTYISTSSWAIENSFYDFVIGTTTSSKESNGFRGKEENTQGEMPVIFDHGGVLEIADNATSGSAITINKATENAVLVSRDASTSNSNRSPTKEAKSSSRQSKYIPPGDFISELPVAVPSRDGIQPSKYNSDNSKHPVETESNWPVIALPPPKKPRRSSEPIYGGNLVHMAAIKTTAEPMRDMRDISRSKPSIRKRIRTRLFPYINEDECKEAAL